MDKKKDGLNKKAIFILVILATILAGLVCVIVLPKKIDNMNKNETGSKLEEEKFDPISIEEVRENVTFNINKEVFNSYDDIIYYTDDFFKWSNENRVDITKKDFEKIAEYLRNEKSGTKIMIYFSYFDAETYEHTYAARQIIDGYIVWQTHVRIDLYDDGTIDAWSFQVGKLRDDEKMLKEEQLKEIIINYLANNPKVYYKSLKNTGFGTTNIDNKSEKMVITWSLSNQNKNIYWDVFLNGWNTLRVSQSGVVNNVEPIKVFAQNIKQ